MQPTRRQFVASSLAMGTFAMLPFRFGPFPGSEAQASSFDPESPMQVVPTNRVSSADFNGDEVKRTHQILWDIEDFIRKNGGLPAPTETVPIVVVGGGMSGLAAGYLLRDTKPIILEQEYIFGGNSKGEQLTDSRSSIGAAYIVKPDAGSDIAKLLTELDLVKAARTEDGKDGMVFMENRFAEGFWHGSTDPGAREDFERVFIRLSELRKKMKHDSRSEDLDKISFADWMKEGGLGGRVHPHIVEYFQLYAWSSFAASIDELSAYQMLDFVTAETGSIIAFPGGNALIAARMHERLVQDLGRERVRAGCLVVDIRLDGDSVIVTYADKENKLQAVRADRVVFAAPKFIAKRVIRNLPAEQARAMSDISYRAYVVANVYLDRPTKSPTYDLYYLNNEVPPAPMPTQPSPRPFSDVVYGSWAQNDQTKTPVLTVYKSFAFDGDKGHLFNPGAHDKYRGRIVEGLKPILKEMGLDTGNIRGVRMTRWGHSMPVARTGMIASGLLERASRPLADRVFFANQDNWASPAFETAIGEAVTAAEAVRKVLRKSLRKSVQRRR